MENVLEKAIDRAIYNGLPMVVYTDKETNSIGYCCIEVFSNKYYDAEYVVLSDGSYEKLGTANVHR